MFDTPVNLGLGLLTGLVFGFLLQKGGLTRYRVILAQFLWIDHTMIRTMLTAIVVGSVGVYALHGGWGVSLHVKDTALLANLLGGLVFGVGMVVLGYCPGTGVGALGDGSRHAMFGLLGMLVGAAFYAEVHPLVSRYLLPVGNLGKVTLPALTNLSPWVFIAMLAALWAVALRLLQEDGRPESSSRRTSGAGDAEL